LKYNSFQCLLFVATCLVTTVSLHAANSITQIQYLSGTDKDHTVPWQFYMTGGGRSNNVLTTIPVPSCWQTKGFGSYMYGNHSGNGSVTQSKSVGQYTTTFSVPASWAGERIYLVYEGVLTDTATMINGQMIAGNITNTTILPPNTNALPNDRAFDNTVSSSPGGNGGGAASSSGNVNLGTLNQFTMTAWVNPQVVISSGYPRIMMVGATPGYDTSGANGAAFLCNNGNGFELTVNTGQVNTPNGALAGTGWYFVAVTYDATLANNNVNFYVGRPASTPVLFSTQTLSEGPVAFGADAYAYLMNRSTLDRAFDGLGDDFRIYTNVLDQGSLELVRSNALSTAAPPSAVAQYQWNFDGATTGTTVTPAVGTGGVLNFTNGAGAAANLYSTVGLGVSGGNSTAITNTTITTTSHQGGFYEFSYDVATNVVVGADTNVLNVTVNEWSVNSSVNSAERQGDFWDFSGIFRPVYLMAKPQSNIQRLAVDARASGVINANVYLSGITNDCLVVGSVTDTNNVQLGSSFTNTVTAGTTNALLSATLPSPQLWSTEFPNLYTLTVQLLDTNYNVIHTVTNLIGFRTITFSNGVGYFVNDTKVVLRGICRHEFWPTDGRTTSNAESDLDIGLIKDMNMNAVRMTHYPPDKDFLDECDRLGLYIFDELTGWQHAYDNTVASNLVQEMVIRDVNHPSIIAWDNGNEGGWNTTVDNNGVGATNVYAIWDPQNRHVQRPSSTFNNVQDDHYPSYSGFTGHIGAGKTAYDCTEILHGLFDGGCGASLTEYWDLMRTAPNGIGMFLWVFSDEGVARNDLAGNPIDVQDQNAPDGVVGPYRQREASYYAYKATYNPAQVTPPNPVSFTGTLAVENRFSFTSLSQCTFDWQLGFFPDPSDPSDASTNALTGGFLVALDSGSFAGPNMAPGTTGSLVLPGFPANSTNYDALRLTATDPFGNNLYTWTFPLHSPAQIRDRILGVASNAPAISAGTSATEIIVTNGPRIFHFDKTTGMINSLTVSNQPVSFSNGPRPVAGSAWIVTGITNYFDGTNYVILLNDVTNAANGFQWTLRPDGWLKLTYRYTLTGSQNWMGVTFDYPSNNVTGMTWLGQGPYRDYKNRLAGQEIFVHTKAANYTSTGRDILSQPNNTAWVYPEFAGYYGQLNWATLQTTEQTITIVTPTTKLFLRVLTPPASGNTNSDTTYPPGAISLLHGISAIGDKFHAAGSSYGPSSVQNTATGLYTGEADFYFGPVVETSPGPAQTYTLDFGGTPVIEAGGTDWNTANSWNPDGQPASVSAYSNPGSTYEIVVGSRLRTPVLANVVFPGTGTALVIDGDGVYEDNTLNAVGELRVKHTGFNPATNYYDDLVLNGGEVFNGDTGLLVLQGRLDVQASSVLYNDVAENRSFQIDSWLTGSGDIFYHDANPPNGIADFNVTGTSNTFTGQWIVDQGSLLGSGAHSLGTNNIIVGTNGLTAAVETLYDINNTNASLVLGANGKMFLHQNDHFASVIINGTLLANGTYPFAILNSSYPVNLPATWTQQIGSTFSSGSGQIVVGNVVTPPPTPQITGIGLNGSTLSLSVSNGTPGGPWALLQSTNVALPLSQWQTNMTGIFDGVGNLSTNIASTATNTQEFYILKVQ
jgi:Glycosyl hydrolases family 2, TIM barrel domain/Glycosyl hydrolases family 2/Glycosyl hydrolases family 2, sugar binding domain